MQVLGYVKRVVVELAYGICVALEQTSVELPAVVEEEVAGEAVAEEQHFPAEARLERRWW